jgi:hypothetical protein
VSNDRVTAKFVFDLGDLKVNTIPDFSNMYKSPAKLENFVNSETGLSIGTIWEDKMCYYIRVNQGFTESNRTNYCIYQKQTGELIRLNENGLRNNVDGGLPFFPQQVEPDGTKITWQSAEDFKEAILALDYDVQKSYYGERFEKVYRLASSLLEYDNPVLIMAK